MKVKVIEYGMINTDNLQYKAEKDVEKRNKKKSKKEIEEIKKE